MLRSFYAFLPECLIVLIVCTFLLKDFKSNNLKLYIALILFVPLTFLNFTPSLHGPHFCSMMVLDRLSLLAKDVLLSFGLVWCATPPLSPPRTAGAQGHLKGLSGFMGVISRKILSVPLVPRFRGDDGKGCGDEGKGCGDDKERHDREINKIQHNEQTILFLLSLLGACCLVSSNHMLTAYLSLELHVLPLIALIALQKEAPFAMEASIKYFVLSIVASIFILYGAGLFYGATGALGFEEILSFKHAESLLFQAGSLFVLSGLLFKLAVFPFHGWAPDVYEGSTHQQVAFIATVSKIAVFFLLLRLRPLSFLDILPWVAVISILFGAFMALRQQNLRRLLAYSGISQMGFVLLGYALKTNVGIISSVIYLGVYALALTGLFLSLKNIETLEDLKGLFHKNPVLAFLVAIMILSFAGIPPIAGFWVKFHILLETVHQGYIYPAILALIGAALSLAYYLNILRMIFFEKGEGTLVVSRKAPLIGIALFLIFFLLLQTPITVMVSKCL